MNDHLSPFRRLEVWQAGMELAEACYRVTGEFPRREWYGLADQIRRAAVSIPSNIAEGRSRRSRAAYAHHLSIALGSHAELEAQLDLARRLSLLSTQDSARLVALAVRTGQMLSALYRVVARRATPEYRASSTEYRHRS